MTTDHPSSLWTTEQLCDFLNVPRSTVYRWRTHGEGPPAYRVGRGLRFDPDDVQAWLEDQAGERQPA